MNLNDEKLFQLEYNEQERELLIFSKRDNWERILIPVNPTEEGGFIVKMPNEEFKWYITQFPLQLVNFKTVFFI